MSNQLTGSRAGVNRKPLILVSLLLAAFLIILDVYRASSRC